MNVTNLEGDKVAKVYTGDSCNLLVTKSGKLYGWGSHTGGLLLNGQTSGFTSLPTRMVTPMFDSDPIVKISASSLNVLVLTQSNKIYGWGANTYGEVRIEFCCSCC